MKRSMLAKQLAAVRLAIGVAAWIAPRRGLALAGLDVERNTQVPYYARLLGSRDAALALGALLTSGEQRRLWLRAALACDAGDVLAGAIGARAGYLPPRAAAIVTGSALAAVVLGIVALEPAGGDA